MIVQALPFVADAATAVCSVFNCSHISGSLPHGAKV